MKKIAIIFIVLVCIGSILSILRWNEDVKHYPTEYCPDSDCKYSGLISNAIFHPNDENLNNLLPYMRTHYHAINPLSMTLLIIPNIFINNQIISYFLLNLIFVILSIYFLGKILIKQIKVSKKEMYFILILFISHLVVIRSFIRPGADSILLFFVIASIYYTQEFITKSTKLSFFYLILLLTLGLFVKIAFIPMLGLPFLLFIFDKIKQHKTFFTKDVFYSILLGIIPFVIWIGFIEIFSMWGAFYSAKTTLEYFSQNFGGGYKHLIEFLIVAFQIYIIFILLNKKIFENKYIIHILWIVLYLGAIISQGHLYNRYALLIIPSILILAYNGIVSIKKIYRWILILSLIIINYFIIIGQIMGLPWMGMPWHILIYFY